VLLPLLLQFSDRAIDLNNAVMARLLFWLIYDLYRAVYVFFDTLCLEDSGYRRGYDMDTVTMMNENIAMEVPSNDARCQRDVSWVPEAVREEN
jgi:hypothetical protein